jgi:hypothetical protein
MRPSQSGSHTWCRGLSLVGMIATDLAAGASGLDPLDIEALIERHLAEIE